MLKIDKIPQGNKMIVTNICHLRHVRKEKKRKGKEINKKYIKQRVRNKQDIGLHHSVFMQYAIEVGGKSRFSISRINLYNQHDQ